jgi:hypothetical protein
MTTRFNAKDEKNYGVSGVVSGYDGLKSDLSIPSCGIEDVDVALFSLFDKEIQPMVGGKDTAALRKVPIIFAAGEKWALLKKGRPLRDKNNSLILPLITIMRTGIAQDMASDIAGRGINQQTGELVVRRRLDKSDRNYQNLINRFFIENQTNVAVNPTDQQVENQIVTNRKIGVSRNKSSRRRGALLQADRSNNIYETIVVPSPQFYTATYEVTVWAQYTQHLNQIIEKLLSSFLPQAQAWKLTSPKGYWFIATVESGNFAIESNFDNMASEERFIKNKFSLKVPAYIWASSAPGVPVPVKRYISSPIIEFNVATQSLSDAPPGDSEQFVNDYLLGSDDPTLPLDEEKNVRSDQRRPGWRSQKVQPSNSPDQIDSNDPALKAFPRGVLPSKYEKLDLGNEIVYMKIMSVNPSTGETVYSVSSDADPEGLKIATPKE